MEVVLDNGCLTKDVKEVLLKWERDYSNLLNANHHNDTSEQVRSNINTSDEYDDFLNAHISILDVKRAIDIAKKIRPLV